MYFLKKLCKRIYIGHAKESEDQEGCSSKKTGTYEHAMTMQENNREISARLLFMAVKWTKNLTSFANLPFRDQVSKNKYFLL